MHAQRPDSQVTLGSNELTTLRTDFLRTPVLASGSEVHDRLESLEYFKGHWCPDLALEILALLHSLSTLNR